jgi:hypothetical protein
MGAPGLPILLICGFAGLLGLLGYVVGWRAGDRSSPAFGIAMIVVAVILVALRDWIVFAMIVALFFFAQQSGANLGPAS